MGRTVWGGVGSRVVFGEDAGAVVGREDEDSIDGEEGHIGRHVGGEERGIKDFFLSKNGEEHLLSGRAEALRDGPHNFTYLHTLQKLLDTRYVLTVWHTK